MVERIKFYVPPGVAGHFYENHGKKWTTGHLVKLYQMFTEGRDCQHMSTTLGRYPEAVVAKMASCGMLIHDYANVYEVSEGYFKRKGLVNHYLLQAQPQSQPQPQAQPQSQPQPQPETITMNAPTIETRTFIDGVDATTMSDEAIFSKIAKLEEQVDKYEKIITKPKKLQVKIDDIKKGIKELADYVDARPEM